MKKLLIFTALISALWSNQDIPLRVGTTSGYAPYVSINDRGEYEGFDIDIIRLIAQKLGRTLVLQDCGSMPGLMLALKQRKVDLLIWAISITHERKMSMNMIYYQGEQGTRMPFLFWKNVPTPMNSLEDLQHTQRKVCVEAGTFQESVVKAARLPCTHVDSITHAVLSLKYGKAIAVPIDPSLVNRFSSQYPELRVVELPLSPEHQSLGNGICIHQDQKELGVLVQQAIDALISEGKIIELEKKWGLWNGP